MRYSKKRCSVQRGAARAAARGEAPGKGSFGASSFEKTALWPVSLAAFQERHFAYSDAVYGLGANSPLVRAVHAMPVVERSAFTAAFAEADPTLQAELAVTLDKATPASKVNPSSLCVTSDFCMQAQLDKLKRHQAEQARASERQAARTIKRTGADGTVHRSVAARKAADKAASSALKAARVATEEADGDQDSRKRGAKRKRVN